MASLPSVDLLHACTRPTRRASRQNTSSKNSVISRISWRKLCKYKCPLTITLLDIVLSRTRPVFMQKPFSTILPRTRFCGPKILGKGLFPTHTFSMTRYVSIGHRLTGWNAVKNRVQQLGLSLTDDEVKSVTAQIKELADIKPLGIEEVDTFLRKFHEKMISTPKRKALELEDEEPTLVN